MDRAAPKKQRHPLAETVRGEGHPAFDPEAFARHQRARVASLAATFAVVLGVAAAALTALVRGGL
jgi:hypothetical protein